MNIFENYLSKIKKITLNNQDILKLENFENLDNINLEVPPDHFNYDLSSNICLVLSKENSMNPINLATGIKDLFLKNISDFKEIEIAGPGFLNIKLSNKGITSNIENIIKAKETYGSKKSNKNYIIEFVSANPTGPMHVGHCRGAIFGDVLSNLLKFNGNKVIKEYYINDYGNQIKNFVESVFLRIREAKYKEKFILNENLYPGIYIKDIATKIINSNKDMKFDNFEKCFEKLKKLSLDGSMSLIKEDLKQLGINHDIFFSETELVKKDLVKKAVNQLVKKNFVEEGYLNPPKGESSRSWKKTKRLIFKSTAFGDDTDRALQKNDGSWTYFANDVAYHSDKINRKFSNLINILGADHTGYIKRISAAVSALSDEKVNFTCKICQLVKLFKDGKPFKMSKRAGEFISAQDLLNEVDKDSIRFMMLNRSNDVELDFDFDKVKEKTKENHVFYVQYAYARINSLFRIIKNDKIGKNSINSNNFVLNKYEEKILRKIFEWPKIVEVASLKYEPHKIPYYLYELSTLFHTYWSKGNEDEKYKFIHNGKVKREEILIIIHLIKSVLKIGMNILGVSLPKKM